MSLTLFIILLVVGKTDAAPPVPFIDAVEMVQPQPHQNDDALIWYDDFDQGPKRYSEVVGPLDETQSFSPNGASMLTHFEAGSRGTGNRKIFFGKNPNGSLAREGEIFDEIYWRVYVKLQHGWQGGSPAKQSRATSLLSNWRQAMIAHVWGGGNNTLTLDPASGVLNGQIVTTKYNDFDNLRWLGNRPRAQFPMFATENCGRWVCVESSAKLDTPGQKDGTNKLWIDGRLETERTGLDFRGTYTEHGINAVFLEAYWNDGSPVTQDRWFDNFVISTQKIGPIVAPVNPILYKMKNPPETYDYAWEVEIASDYEGDEVVWQSNIVEDALEVEVNLSNGEFINSHADLSELKPGQEYYIKIRQQDNNNIWSDWSRWHQPFVTEITTTNVETSLR